MNTVNGKNVINFSVAHTEKFRDAQGNNQEKTTWVDCAYWTDRTTISPYLTKGKQVYVDGNPDVRSYEKNDGTPGASLSLRVREIQLLGGRSDTGGFSSGSGNVMSQEASVPVKNEIPSPSDVTEPIDDLPF